MNGSQQRKNNLRWKLAIWIKYHPKLVPSKIWYWAVEYIDSIHDNKE